MRHGLLRGVDRAAFATAFADRLRRAGVPAGLTEAGDFVRALGVWTPGETTVLYWAARISFVRRHADLAAFDSVFAAVFADAPAPP
ncbi:hypothetical protein ACWIGG_13350 [Micromonospora aurantiaca (nom. illeg.)]